MTAGARFSGDSGVTSVESKALTNSTSPFAGGNRVDAWESVSEAEKDARRVSREFGI
ncbi:MAG: hypothetical protein ACRD2X_20805 [Vicinamibacteraceae bacterium]